MISSMLLCGDRSDILNIVYILYRPYSRRLFNIPSRTLQGSARPPNGSRAALEDTFKNLLYIFTKSGKNNRAVPGRCPVGPFRYATHLVLNGLFTGCLFYENARRIGSRLFDTPAPVWWLKLTRRP